MIQLIHQFAGTNSSGYLPYHIDRFVDLFTNATNEERLAIEGIQSVLASSQQGALSSCQTLSSIANALLIEMVNADNPLPAYNIDEAVRELRYQMQAGSETVNASEPTATVSYGGSNNGDGLVFASVVDELGAKLERAIVEDIAIRINSETSATAYGQASRSSEMDISFPTGSGSTTALTIVNMATSGVLDNGNFDTWNGSSATGWTLGSGAIAREQTIVRTSGGSSLTVASGTMVLEQTITGRIAGQTQYLLAVGLRSSVGAPTSGSVTLSVTDGSSAIADEASTSQVLTIGFASITTSWQTFGKIVQFADPLPATVKFKIEITAGFDRAVFFDDLTFGVAAAETYEGGPRLAMTAGTTAWGLDDRANVAIANTLGSFQHWFGRLFPGTPLLPAATGGGETIGDALIA